MRAVVALCAALTLAAIVAAPLLPTLALESPLSPVPTPTCDPEGRSDCGTPPQPGHGVTPPAGSAPKVAPDAPDDADAPAACAEYDAIQIIPESTAMPVILSAKIAKAVNH